MSGKQQSIVDRLFDQAERTPEALAFRFVNGSGAVQAVLTYAGLVHRVAGLAHALARHASPGDRVVLLCRPGLDSVVATYACMMAGLIAVPCAGPHVNRIQSQSERLIGVARDCSPTVILAPDDLLQQRDAFAALAWELAIPLWLDVGDVYHGSYPLRHGAPADVAFLQYTSGSTASPRGVKITHRNIMANQELVCQVTRTTDQSELMSWLPFYHDMGLCFYFQGVYLGIGTTLMSPLDFARRPLDWLHVLSKFRCSGTAAPNFALDRITEHLNAQESPVAVDLSNVRALVVGAERIDARTLTRFCASVEPLGWNAATIFPCYGLAESTLMVTRPLKGGAVIRPFAAKALAGGKATDPGVSNQPEVSLVSNGRCGSDHHLLIVDPVSRAVLPEHAVGEIWISGASVSPGYWSPAADQSNFKAAPNRGGKRSYLRTGDLGFQADGELYVTGRLKDLIIVCGRNLYPDEIEQTVRAADTCIGEGVAAIEWPSAGNLAIVAELRQRYPTEAIAAIERIRRAVATRFEVEVPLIALCAPRALPRTTSGKIRRGHVRTALEQGELVPVAGWQPLAASPSTAAPQGESKHPPEEQGRPSRGGSSGHQLRTG